MTDLNNPNEGQFWYISLKNEGMDRIIYSKKQSPDTKKVSEFCFLNYIILQTISIIRMATDE